MNEKQSVLLSSALAVLLERAGGEMSYTQTEITAVRVRRGEYVITGEVDRSGPGEPLIRIKLEPSDRKGSMPVS
jgi:hypothetical protein